MYLSHHTQRLPVVDEPDPDPLDAFALLDDEYARSILAALSEQPMTATTISDQCDMSLTTVYRRLNRLEQCGFVTSRTDVDPEGHHRKRYEVVFEELQVRIDDGEFEVSFSAASTTMDFADTFTSLWEGL